LAPGPFAPVPLARTPLTRKLKYRGTNAGAMFGAYAWSDLKKLEMALMERTHARAALAQAQARADEAAQVQRLVDQVTLAEARVRALVLRDL
jgi:hypothetical protein